MLKIFISYSRHEESISKDLAKNISSLDYTVWFDQDLVGGDNWWEKILTKIEECDLFIFICSERSLDSSVCAVEHKYAEDLGKNILFLMNEPGIPPDLLPGKANQIQIVDYIEKNDESAFKLIESLSAFNSRASPQKKQIDRPKHPDSELRDLLLQIEEKSFLKKNQKRIFNDLKKIYKKTDKKEYVYFVLEKMKSRAGKYIALKIDYLVIPYLAKQYSWYSSKRILSVIIAFVISVVICTVKIFPPLNMNNSFEIDDIMLFILPTFLMSLAGFWCNLDGLRFLFSGIFYYLIFKISEYTITEIEYKEVAWYILASFGALFGAIIIPTFIVLAEELRNIRARR